MPGRRPQRWLRVALPAAVGLASALGACSASRVPAIDPRFVAVHNTLSAMGLAHVGSVQQGTLVEGREARLPLELTPQCATIVAIFPVISNTTLGLRSVDAGLLELFRMNKATRLQTLVRLRIPSALPYFFGGLRIASGLALIGAVVAEFVAGTGGSGAGLAYQILQSGLQLNVPRLFAALFLGAACGVAFAVLFFVMTVAVEGTLPGTFNARSLGVHLLILLAVAPLGAAAVAVLGQRYAMARMRF